MESDNLVVVTNPLLGLDASIEVWTMANEPNVGPPLIAGPIFYQYLVVLTFNHLP